MCHDLLIAKNVILAVLRLKKGCKKASFQNPFGMELVDALKKKCSTHSSIHISYPIG